MLCLQHAQVLLGLEDLDGAFLVGRSHNNLGENLLDLLGHLHGDLTVHSDDSAKGRHRVAGVSRAVSSRDGLLRHRDAARVGVLDDGHARALVIPGGAPGGVRILVVVVAHLLAVELLRVGQTSGTDAGHGRGLVRVLAVAQRGGLLALAELIDEPCGHRGVIISGVQEGIAGQTAALLQGKAAVGHRVSHLTVASRIHNHSNRRVVLGSRAHHGRSTDIDLFHAAIKVCARSYRLTEGVQIHHDELERIHLQLLQLLQVVLLAGIRQDPRMHARVQGLDSTLEALREAGELLDGRDLNAQVRDLLRGGTGGNDLHAGLIQGPGKVLQTGLVVHADECALDVLTIFAHGTGT